MPKLPLLPLWEKGVGGMRGKSARECSKPRISPRNSTLEMGSPPRHNSPRGRASPRLAEGFPRRHTIAEGFTPTANRSREEALF
jgi:hypothetical protein